MDKVSAKFVKTPSGSIFIDVQGDSDGIPLIVINGGPGSDHSHLKFSGSWEDLGSKRPIIFYDQRGTGQSFPVKEGDSCTLVDQLSDIEAVRNHLNFKQVDLLGHSWGGFLGMAYTAWHPSRVRRLVLVGSAAPRLQDTIFLFKHAYPETVERQNDEEFGIEMGDDKAIQRSMREYFSMLFVSTEMRDAFLEKVDPKTYNHKVNVTLWNDALKFDLTPELLKFKQQTLVLTGRFDMNVATSVAYGIHKTIPGSEFVVFEQSGHLPFFEEQEAFVQVVNEFLLKD